MFMVKSVILSLFFLLFAPFGLHAQTDDYRLLHQANKAFRAKEYNRAADLYLSVLKAHPDHPRATFNLADSYLAKGDGKAADSLFKRVTQLAKNKQVRAMAWHNLGYISQVSALQDKEARQHLLREAIERYKNALRLAPYDDNTRYNLALCLKQLKDDKNQQQPQKEPQSSGEEQKQQSQEQKQPEDKPQAPKPPKRQTEQYLNLSNQAERRALEKLKGQQPRSRGLEKNW